MKKFLVYATLLAALPLAAQVVTSPANDQGPLTRQQGEQFLQKLRQTRQLLERQQPKPAAPQEEAPIKAKLTDLSGVPMLGSKSAPHSRASSPPSGFSTLITSAPRSAMITPANGPASA